ncbi:MULTISPECIES: alpha/beta hydrolase family esterase [unclassified Meridianimarinicoccus]|uniref:alpha/beta hydrolase family esterase n=1 Tax=unclassified Meridianimarinicoccus TaxID=2923344 RepID=UPI0018668015|nr:prolyl oligopeptidase family serine peptidase [Fluviibacterium sp. MJW13]
MRARAALLLGAAVALCGGAASACSDPGAVCEIDGGTYHVALPEAVEGPIPALIWLHGYGGTGAGSLRTPTVAAPFLARGWAVIAPNGSPMAGNRAGYRWDFRGRNPDGRDDAAFLTQVRDDAAARFGLDPGQVVLGGFSNGAFMATYVACDTPRAFTAYAPVAGTFWRPHPETCEGPVRLFQTHGWRDTTVPLEGRPLGGGRFLQGDVFEAMSIWRSANGCARPDASTTGQTDGFLLRRWSDCAEGAALQFALFDGGHTVPKGWADLVLDWIEDAGGD